MVAGTQWHQTNELTQCSIVLGGMRAVIESAKIEKTSEKKIQCMKAERQKK